MRKRIAMAAAGAMLFGVPAAAHGATDSPTDNAQKQYEKRYLELRDRYVKRFGVQAAGRDIVTDGYRLRNGRVREATRAEVRRSIDGMVTQLQPPAAATASATPAATTTTTTTSSASSSTVQCESGGDYSAVNPAGYYGAYQFDQSTWNAYAPAGYQGVNPASAPPAVQDAAAANVPYDAWPNC
jgi:hypothetical protein